VGLSKSEKDAIRKAKKWSKEVDKTEKRINEANKSTNDPEERLRKLLED